MKIESEAPWAEASADYCKLIDEASEATRLLRDLVHCSAFNLSAWDPISLTHRHQTLAGDGYSEATLFHVNDEFVKNSRAFAIAHREDPRPLRWRA